MSVTSNALLRHITIDACLRDTAHKYSLIDLIAACTRAIRENSKGKENANVSMRTLQLDLQFMRDKKKGYNAPIVVYEQKYYKYKDPNYSIGNANIKQTNLAPLSEIAETLRRYTQIAGMESLVGAVSLIEDVIENKVSGGQKRISGLKLQKISDGKFNEVIKDAVLHRKVLSLSYYQTDSNTSRSVIFYPLYMKIYANRWFVLGYEEGREGVHAIPTDAVTSYSYAILPFPPNYTFNPDSYFKDIIGVTKPQLRKEEITILVKEPYASFLASSPIHSSQRMMSREENGEQTFHLSLIPNDEFYRWVYENTPMVSVVSPKSCAISATNYIKNVIKDLPSFTPEKPKRESKKKKPVQSEPDLFSMF